MKKVGLLLISLIASFQLFPQALSIEETVKYIDNALAGKENTILYSIKTDYRVGLDNEGMLIIDVYESQLTSSYQREDYWKRDHRSIEKIYVRDISSVNYDSDFFSNRIRLVCGSHNKDCVFFEHLRYNKTSNSNSCTIDVTGISKYEIDKIVNAFNYLLSLIKNTDKYSRIDSDPFSPDNFRLLRADIESKVDNTAIKLTFQNGVYLVPVFFSDIDKSFILDSGASDVNITEALERQLISAGIIKRDDYLTPGLYRIADGSIIQCRRLVLNNVRVGSFIVSNVAATVGDNSSPLLLGKSFLDKFSEWSINNQDYTLELTR